MDVRLFKFLMFAATEALLGILLFFEWKYFYVTRVGSFVFLITRFFMMTLPVLLLLPEDNWIWLLEEDLRSRKITLRSKAVKHLHLSMLYLLAIGYPTFLICISLFTKWEKYRFEPALIMGTYGILYGIYCAFKNYRNVKKYDTLFAVGWDRKSSFLEIFVGVKVSRNMKFFYKGFSLIAGVIFLAGSAFATPLYFKFFQPLNQMTDKEKFIVMQAVFCTMFSISVWIVTMYVSFQVFFTRRLEAWVREKKSTISKNSGGESL